MDEVNVYIYTTVKGPKKKHGAYTYILETDTAKGTATRSETKVVEEVTAHRAELIALAAAVKRINRRCVLNVYMDSVYVASCMEKWLDKWKSNDWKNAKGKPVSHMEEWQELDRLLDKHNYRFVIGCEHSYYEWLKSESERAEKECIQ